MGDRVVRLEAPYALAKAGLLAAAAFAPRRRSVRRKQWDGGAYAYSMHLFGCESDLERTELLFTSLLVQASYGGDRLALRLAEAYPRLGTVAPRRLMGSGVRDGYAAGQRADLGSTRVGRPALRRLGAR